MDLRAKMRRLPSVTLTLLLAGAALLPWGCRRKEDEHTVTIHGTTWRVELAVTEEKQFRGLAGRKRLDEHAGMLFVFDRSEVRKFVMRDCLIPLDIAFIGADLRVVRMHTMAVETGPGDYVLYSSGSPAQFALEVPAGALMRAGVTIGDAVTLSEGIPHVH